MSDERKSLRTIFNEAAEILDSSERTAFLQRACAGDETLRHKLADLLSAHQHAGGFLNPDGAPTVVAPITEGPGTTIGRYKLLQKIGEGGMGVVYMAEQQEPVRRQVALKIIKLGMDTGQVVARFEAERQALALMDHPNIAKVFDAGATETGRPYFVMELVRGVPITEYCDKTHLPTRDRLQLFILVCQPIQHAHQKGIIHRDIKPTNILVTLNDGVPHPMVIDFGIAKATNQRLTEKTLFTNFAAMIGTPAYMSPEQAEMSKLDVDTRTDIYSLGVLLYELLTGTTPIPREQLQAAGYGEMQRLIREDEPEPPSTRLSTMREGELRGVAGNRAVEPLALRKVLRRDLDWITMKALEKDRRRRYDTAKDFTTDVLRYLRSEPVLAKPPTVLYKAERFIRRHRAAVGAASFILLVLIIGLLLLTLSYQRERAARRLANVESKRAQNEAERAQAETRHAQLEERRARANEMDARRSMYASDMLLAQQALTDYNLGQALRLLEKYHPKERSEPDLRGWEWRYLWNQTRSDEQYTLGSFSNTVWIASWSLDGARILTADEDGILTIWDVARQRPIRKLTRPDEILDARFLPQDALLVLARHRQTITIWDSRTDQTLEFPSGEDSLLSACISADGKFLAAAGKNWVRLWDIHDHQEIGRPPRAGPWASDVGLAFSRDGATFAYHRGDSSIGLWDVERAAPIAELKGHRNHVSALAFSPDGRSLASGGLDRTARVWSLETYRERYEPIAHSGPINCVAFSPDGQTLATAGADQQLWLWDAASGQSLRRRQGHTHELCHLAFSPTGKWIATASKDATVRVWSPEKVSQPIDFLTNSPPVYVVLPSVTGESFLTFDGLRTMTIWNAQTLNQTASFPSPDGIGEWAAISPRGDFYATEWLDSTIRIFETKPFRLVKELREHTNGISIHMTFSGDGKGLAVPRYDHTIGLWDLTGGVEEASLRAREKRVTAVTYSRDGEYIGAGYEDGVVEVWRKRDRKQVVAFSGHKGIISSVLLLSDGRRAVSAAADSGIKIWDVATGKEIATPVGHLNFYGSLAESTDGSRLAAGVGDGTIKIWELQNYQEVATLRGHADPVQMLAFPPDGNTLTSVSRDSIHRWVAAPLPLPGATQPQE